jgi:hypothetical protein
MAKQRKRPPAAETWAGCKRVIQSWPRAGVVALVQELYRLSDENRRFLHARLLPERSTQSIDAAAKKISRLVSPREIFNNHFRHAGIKRVIDQFEKATDNPAPVAELLLADLSASLSSFAEVGDFEPIVDHVYATMERLDKLLTTLAADDAASIRAPVERLNELAKQWGAEFGWGVSDELVGLAYEWRKRLEGGIPRDTDEAEHP